MTKVIFMDVDGTLTDGKIYIGDKGEMFKAFSVKDGYAIGVELKNAGIIPVIVTARQSVITEQRCKELGIIHLYQGVKDKPQKMIELLKKIQVKTGQSIGLCDVAYIGDDITDLECMEMINEAGGLTGCPVDAVKSVKELCDYVCESKGGEGAVREFIERLIEDESGRIGRGY